MIIMGGNENYENIALFLKTHAGADDKLLINLSPEDKLIPAKWLVNFENYLTQCLGDMM